MRSPYQASHIPLHALVERIPEKRTELEGADSHDPAYEGIIPVSELESTDNCSILPGRTRVI